MTLKVSELLQYKITPFLYGVFLSRTVEKSANNVKYLSTYTSYKASRRVFDIDFNFDKYIYEFQSKLNYYSGYSNWVIEKHTSSMAKIYFTIINDMDLTTSNFVKILYSKLNTEKWFLDDNLNEEKKQFMRGFFESRGAVDTTAKFISQDYFYKNNFELQRVVLLSTALNIPLSFLNVNFRDLQPQYTNNISLRNTQLRINSFWYANKIGFLNKYKAKIFENSFSPRNRRINNDIIYFDCELNFKPRSDSKFLNYINFFTNFIYEKKLTPDMVRSYRDKLGFNSTGQTSGRDINLINLFSLLEEDKCAICGTTHTFENNKTGRQHFEIHHVISYANGKQFDNYFNLVKLCPTCHDSLSKGRAPKKVQLNNILTILNNKPQVLEYVSSYFGTDDKELLCEKIWEMLG